MVNWKIVKTEEIWCIVEKSDERWREVVECLEKWWKVVKSSGKGSGRDKWLLYIIF